MKAKERTVVVIGAGIVGVCVALWSRLKGLDVLLLDPEQPGSGTSSGNACAIADYGCVPVNNPALPLRLPGMLLNSETPLRLNLGHVLTNPVWSLGFLANCRRSRVEYIANALARLLQQVNDGLQPLLDHSGTASLLSDRGCLYLYGSRKGFEKAAWDIQLRKQSGIAFDTLDPAQIAELEPAVGKHCYRGLMFPGARQVGDPEVLVQRLFQSFQQQGGRWQQTGVRGVQHDDRQLTVQLESGDQRTADYAVVAAGAFSSSIIGTGAEDLPLGVERGYNIQYEHKNGILSRPVGFADYGFYATPMDRGLRIAGTVEIDSIEAPKNRKVVRYLETSARKLLGDLGSCSSDWLGYRPTMPDSLPVIGTSHRSGRIIFAFGHQHIGLTLAGITGRIVSDLLTGNDIGIDIEPYSPTRFRSARNRAV